jgi:hypothetical protein
MDQPNSQTFSTHATDNRPRLVLMWRGNIRAPEQPTNHQERFKPLIAALGEAGVEISTLVYFDSEAEAARARLLQADGVMVWINPLQDGQDRTKVDALLREVYASGVWVSAHPDTILRMGTKEVLYLTRELGWGADTDLYRSFDDFSLRFPVKLAVAGARVLKPLRGNDGQGVLKVEPSGSGRVVVQAASDDESETLPLSVFVERMRGVFATSPCIIDQAFQQNVGAGMVRCYMSLDRVVGFSEQTPRRDEGAFGMKSAKTMHGADASAFQDLRQSMERDWTPGMQRLLGLETRDLPTLWDADFLYRAPGDVAASRFVLCEINVSSVSPFPEAAIPAIARTVAAELTCHAI